MVELEKTSLSGFVVSLPENLVKKIIWDKYYQVKNDTEIEPKLKNKGSFAGVLAVLEEYAKIFHNPRLVVLCEFYFCRIFMSADPELLMDSIKADMEREELDIEIWDYEKALDYIRKKYGKWLAGMEFSGGDKNTEYITTSAPELKSMQEAADGLGLQVHLFVPESSVGKATEEFFAQLEEAETKAHQEYNTFEDKELYDAYKRFADRRCLTLRMAKMRDGMDKVYFERKKEQWKKKLKEFKELTKDRISLCPKLFYGDNEEKVQQAHEFMSAGKFEFVYLGNDTTRKGNGTTGMVISTESLYYKTKLAGGEIPLSEITHFSYEGKMLGQALVVKTMKGKKITVPYEIPVTERLKYIKVLEELLRIARG